MTSAFGDDPLAVEAPLRLHAHASERGEGVATWVGGAQKFGGNYWEVFVRRVKDA